jgi:hypothetical protein
MGSRIIRDKADLAALVTLLGAIKLPITVSWVAGADRSHEQNHTMWMWANEAAAQLQDREADDIQAEWKLTIGVPILRGDDAAFREAYDQAVKGLSYEDKIRIMRDLDFPVTRLMKVRQMCRFMNQVQQKCSEMGIELTQPPHELDQYIQRYGRAA